MNSPLYPYKAGFSLIEVLVAMLIFPMITLAIVKGVIWNQQVGHYVVYENVVHHNVENYLAQIKAMDYAIIKSAAETGTGAVVPTKSLAGYYSALETPENDEDTETVPDINAMLLDELVVGAWTERFVRVGHANPDAGSTPRYLNLKLRLSITDHSDPATLAGLQGDYCVVRLDYEWTPNQGTFLDSKTIAKSASIIVVDREFSH